jgi:hypothetical protein
MWFLSQQAAFLASGVGTEEKKDDDDDDDDKRLLFLCFLTKHHAMKTYWGSGGRAPLIL